MHNEETTALGGAATQQHARRRAVVAGLCVAVAASAAMAHRAGAEITGVETPPQAQIISADIDVASGYFSIINVLTGADRFYNAGYFGTNATIANVEAGYVWDGHETLNNVFSYVSNSTAAAFDYHATMVGFTMIGLGPITPTGYNYYQFGMAPGAQFTSVAIATDFGPNGTFDISSSTFAYGYVTAMRTGIVHEILPGLSFSRTADVINSSYGFEDSTGSSQATMIIDALAFTGHQTVCVAAGNHSVGTALVTGPASGFNTIAVAALGTDLSVPRYAYQAAFSNAGPNDFYNPQTGQTTVGVRAAVSISAPGTDLILPAYLGATGGNSDGTLFDTTGIPDSELTELYFIGVDGTSFASPIVAGGAALLVDAGYDRFGGGHSVDGRVIKAVLLNSADKLPGWTNNTVKINGVLTTTQGLDWNLGAGGLDLNRAYDQFLSGTTGLPTVTGGTVHPLGWDFGHVTAAIPNDYRIDTPLHAGDTFTTTLTWFVDVVFNDKAVADPETDNFADADLHDTYFDQLDLQVWEVADGELSTLIADSTSPYNNTDHLYFSVPEDGMYAIRVSWMGMVYDVDDTSPLADDYGLAWSVDPVPEPATLGIFVPWLLCLCRRSRRVVPRRGWGHSLVATL